MHWVENGSPIEHFMEILSLKKADAELIYSVLIDWLKMNNIQCNKVVQQIVDVWNRKPRRVNVRCCFIVASQPLT